MQSITPVTTDQLLAPGQQPKLKFEISIPDNYLGTMNFDSGFKEPKINEILTGVDSGSTAKVVSVNKISGTWISGDAAGNIELRTCSGCFNDNENINGSVGGANMLTANHPDGTVGVDKIIKNGAFVHDVDPPNDWTADVCTLTTEPGGKVGNCMKIVVAAATAGGRQDISVVAGRIYKLSFYYKVTAPDVAQWLIYDLSNAAYIVPYTDLADTAGAWSSVQTHTFEAPAGCSSIRVGLWAKNNTDIVYLDEITLYELNEWINLCDLGGKNYLEDLSISLGGASMTPNPIAGSWSAMINNENGIFHPAHPASAYKDYLRAGRKMRISIGGKYGGTDYYWQRLIGYMDEPSFQGNSYAVSIKGCDYMKRLIDTELRMPNNYWGADVTKSTIATEITYATEIYDEADAVDIDDDLPNMNNWAVVGGVGTITSEVNAGGGSVNVGLMQTGGAPVGNLWIRNIDVGQGVAGKKYKFKFMYNYAGAGGTGSIKVYIRRGTTTIKTWDISVAAWTQFDEEFVCPTSGTLRIDFLQNITDQQFAFRYDIMSIRIITGISNSRYDMPAACTGPYYVTLDGSPVWYGIQDEGWRYDDVQNQLYFDGNKLVDTGTDNLVIYYFTTQIPEEVVADLLVTAGLYANQAAALAAMDYTATGITIDRAWFEAGSSALDTIKKICERCDYRFHFSYDGIPVFKPAPTKKPPTLEDFSLYQCHYAEPNYYQDKNEIRNRIVIEGEKRAQLVGKEETAPSELRGEASDTTSINDYGEHTLTIKNHLFQDQSSIDSMCSVLLAKYKDPKLYFDFEAIFNPAPIEMGDTLRWQARLSPPAGDGKYYGTFKYNSGVTYGSDNGIVIIQRGIIRDIKISKYDVTYKCEEVN